MGLDVGQELLLGSVGDVVPEGLGEELVRGGEVLLAVPEQHTGPCVEGGSGRLGHERGLAQTGFARDEEHLAPFAPGHPLDGVGHGLALGVASDHTHWRAARPDDRTVGIEVRYRFPEAAPKPPRRFRRDRADLFRVSSPRDRHS